MLFLVPDEPDAGDAGQESSSISAPKGKDGKDFPKFESLKVELDLDDAPFLEEEEKPPPPPAPEPKAPEPPKPEPAPEPRKSFFARKKKLVIGAAGLLLLLLCGGGAALFFLGGGDDEGTQGTVALDIENVIIVQVNGTHTDIPDYAMPSAHVVELDPFIVPHTGSEGEVRFFRFVLALPLEEAIQVQEVEARLVELRGALYYYLSNRNVHFNISEEEYQSFKQDLVSVINEHISVKKITEVYILESLVTGE